MKKILSATLIAGLFSSAAFAQTTVSSANIVGYAKIDLQPGGKYTLAACNFQAGATNTLLSVFGTDQLTQDDNYGNCDRIILWNPSTQLYQAWAQWTDGVFYKANDGAEWALGISGNPEIPVGKGFFISSGNVSNAIYLSGDVITATTQTVNLVEGYQILGNTFSSDIALQNTSFASNGAAADDNYGNCDRIHVWEGDRYQAYALWTDGVWYKANDGTQWAEGIAATNQLSLSQGFFYEAKVPMVWTASNPYSANLQN